MDREAEAEALLVLHAGVLDAHRRGDVDSWMASEADTVVSANRGVISFSSAEERREKRERYLGSTTFTVYRDFRAPIVSVSEDGTLGWVIAEVEVKGTRESGQEEPTPVEAVWAWIELYQKREGVWTAVGNVSNRRP
jgi:ketosteroid isomerase-like protein